MRGIKWLFYVAGIYGVLVISPLYLKERQLAAAGLPGINHPEFFYGFIGVGLAWQIVFLMIGTDPLRYRPIILIAALVEKLGFGIPALLLYQAGRLSKEMLGAACLDLLLAVLFLIAWWKLGKLKS